MVPLKIAVAVFLVAFVLVPATKPGLDPARYFFVKAFTAGVFALIAAALAWALF